MALLAGRRPVSGATTPSVDRPAPVGTKAPGQEPTFAPFPRAGRMRILRADLTTRCTFTAPPDGVVVLFVMVARPRRDTAVAVTPLASTGSDELETKDNP